MKRTITLLLIIISLCVTEGVALAKIIRVPQDQPTIQAGINVAVAGDTVLVANGTYTGRGNVNIDFKGKPITVRSVNGAEVTIIDCENRNDTVGFIFQSGENTDAILNGFTITNGNASISGGGIYCYKSSPTINNNIIIGNSAQSGGGIYIRNDSAPTVSNNIITRNKATRGKGGGIACVETTSPLIKGNIITDNSAADDGGGISCLLNSNAIIEQNAIKSNSSGGHAGGIACETSSPTISRNSILNNQHEGIYCLFRSSAIIVNNLIAGNTDRGGIRCWESSPTIINNTIYGNSVTTGHGGISCVNRSSPVVINTILWDNGADEIYKDFDSRITIIYSDVQGGWEGEGNINADPLFVDAANGDYRLLPNSPGIDAGTADNAPDMDIQGHRRSFGDGVDIGAFEQVNLIDSVPVTFRLLDGGGFRVNDLNTIVKSAPYQKGDLFRCEFRINGSLPADVRITELSICAHFDPHALKPLHPDNPFTDSGEVPGIVQRINAADEGFLHYHIARPLVTADAEDGLVKDVLMAFIDFEVIGNETTVIEFCGIGADHGVEINGTEAFTVYVRSDRRAPQSPETENLELEIQSLSIVRLSISPSSAEPISGEIENFNIVAFDTSDEKVDLDDTEVTWEVIGEIGSVTKRGRFTGTKAGNGQLRATLISNPRIFAEAEIHVVPGEPAHIDLEAGLLSLPADSSSKAKLTIAVTDASDNRIGDVKVFLAVKGVGAVSDVAPIDDGRFTATYTAGSTPGTVKIVVETANGLVQTLDLTLTGVSSPPSLKAVSGGRERTSFTVLEGDSLVIALIATDSNPSEILTISISEDGLPKEIIFSSEISTSPAEGRLELNPNFEQGRSQPYIITATAKDSTNTTVSLPLSITVTDVNRAPGFNQSLSDPKTAFIGRAFSLTVHASDLDGDTVIVTAEILPAGATFDMGNRTFRWTPTTAQEGEHDIRFTADDGKGGTTQVTVSVTVKLIGPVWEPLDIPQAREGDGVTFRATASHPQNERLILSFKSEPELPNVIAQDGNSLIFRWTPNFESAGTYNLTFTAVDSIGLSVDLNRTLVVENVNNVPVLQPIPTPQTIRENQLWTLVVEANDRDSDDTLTFTVSALPSRATFNPSTRTITWRPSYEQAGEYRFTIRVTDGRGGSDSQSVSLVVQDNNRKPTLSTINPPRELVEGTRINFSVTATDADEDNVLTFGVTPRPSGSSLRKLGTRNAIFEWTPAIGQARDYNLTFSVNDGKGGSNTQTVSLKIAKLDDLPPEGTAKLDDGKEIDDTFYVTARNVSLRFSVKDNLSSPAEIQIQLRNKGEDWTPHEAFSEQLKWRVDRGDGEKTVEVRFTDAVGNTSEPEALTFTLDTTPPKIAHSPITSGTVGGSISIKMTASDASPIAGKLFYRPGGEFTFRNISAKADGNILTGEIPADALQHGVSYYLEVEDVLGHVTTYPEKGISSPIGVVVSGTFSQETAFPAQSWHLFSVPVLASGNLVPFLDSLVGQENWVVDTWNGTTNVQTVPTAMPGKSFWLISKTSFQLKVSGDTANLAKPQTLALQRGWNLVANPYLFPVAFGNMRVIAGNASYSLVDPKAANFVRPKFWRWKDDTPNDVTDGDYEVVTNLSEKWAPWSGYWIFADAEATVNFEPFTELVESPVALAPEAQPLRFDWLATLSIGNERGLSRVHLGVSEVAQWGDDPLDVEQPPLPTKVSLSLLQRNSDVSHESNVRFQRISLPADADEWLWDAEMQAHENATLTLTDPLPIGYHAYLEYLSDGSRVVLSPGNSIQVPDGRHRIRIRLTRQRLGFDVVDVTPTATQLLQNYPNPFNPETWFPFTLSQASTVEIVIFDASGRRMRLLSLGLLDAGRYSDKERAAYWDGRNDIGEPVASGVYFVELRTRRYRQTRRIVLLK